MKLPDRLHPAATSRALVRTAAAALTLLSLALLAACDDGGSVDVGADGTATATPSRTPVGTTPTIEPTSSGSATGTPSATPGDQGVVGWGVVTVEVTTGQVVTLYEGRGETFQPGVGLAFAPWPEARNNGIWLSPTTDQAIRYALDGAVEERVDGWGVLEAPRGDARSYFTGGPDGVTLVVEGAEGRRAEVDGLNVSNRTFSADGRWLAWLDATPQDENLVMVLELTTGDVTEVARVTPCACDGYHYIEWSPSGRYLAYEDPAYQDPARQGLYLFDTQEPEADHPGFAATPVVDGWIEADETELILTLDDGVPTLFPVAVEADSLVIEAPGDGALRAGTLQGLVMVSTGAGPETVTRIFDPVSGELLRELRGASDAVLTPRGIATAVISRNDLTCTGIQVDHPTFSERLDCTAEDLRWSPDGRYLALIPQAVSDPVTVLDVTTGTRTEVPHAGPRGTVPTWSEDGRYLVWVWGGQL
ncbi:MAG: hypothetical protein AB7F65_09315 [Dehalococcoidia bacterium]